MILSHLTQVQALDGIFLTLLQEGQEILIPYLIRIFHACLATGCVTAAWRQVKVVFIPKPGRNSYCGPKDFRPITLTLFLLKTIERLVDRFLKMKFWLLNHYNPINMHTRLVSLWIRLFISSWCGLRRSLIRGI